MQEFGDTESILEMASEIAKQAVAGEIGGAVTMLLAKDLTLIETLYAGNVRRSPYAIGFAAKKLAQQMAWV